MVEHYTPKVNVAKELSEISKDFTNPRELVRETIANSLDASASRITIEAFKDDSSGEDELVVRIVDDGVGMTKTDLEAFFDLGYSRKTKQGTIGNKGHGTKITYNSSHITVTTRSINGGPVLVATLASPRKALNVAVKQNGIPPPVDFEEFDGPVEGQGSPFLPGSASGTVIEIRGYDSNNSKAFAHDPLRDYIQWFTAWGKITFLWGDGFAAPCTLQLRGIGSDKWETVEPGHPFPPEDFDFRSLRNKDDRRPENHFVRRWVSDTIKVQRFPEHEVRIVFSVEGDSAKRAHNAMLKRVGRPAGTPYPFEWARYTVSDRYGIHVCRDGIPIERKNERFADRSEWTKWHAFVNSQSFSLTANRASVENTPADLLAAIYETAEQYITNHILGSDEYEDFARRIELEAGRRKAEREKRDVGRRYKEYQSKKRFRASDNKKEIQFLQPRTEQGVVWLLARLIELWPGHFPDIRVIDLDSHFGYDLLVIRKHHLTGEEEPAFVELKHNLRDAADFNHSFDYLNAIVCWETNLSHDEEILDIQGKKRVFKVTNRDDDHAYTRYFLNNPSGGRNIEVVVLRKYLAEVLNLEERMKSEDGV